MKDRDAQRHVAIAGHLFSASPHCTAHRRYLKHIKVVGKHEPTVFDLPSCRRI